MQAQTGLVLGLGGSGFAVSMALNLILFRSLGFEKEVPEMTESNEKLSVMIEKKDGSKNKRFGNN